MKVSLEEVGDNVEKMIKKFLKKLSTDGILDERKLLTPRKLHSYAELIDSEYRKTFDAIKVDIFEKISFILHIFWHCSFNPLFYQRFISNIKAFFIFSISRQ